MSGEPAPSRRLAVVGNAGSGKTTLARRLSAERGLVHLDLDSIVWTPGRRAVARERAVVEAELDAFCAGHEAWVVEGCYGGLAARALAHGAELVLVDPGEAACLARCRARPFEPHKFASAEEQQAWLAPLLAWVRDYYRRDDECSLAHHERLYREHAGRKRRIGADGDDVEPPA